MSKGKRARPSANAWFFALGIPLVALFVLFSLLPYDRMVAQWPLDIGKEEVMAYEQIFDHRPGQHAKSEAEELLLDPGPGDTMRISAGEDRDTAVFAELSTGVLALEFPMERPFRGRKSIILVPADLRSLQVKYAQVVADSLGILGPGLSVVQVVRAGRRMGPYLEQERITPAFLLKKAPVCTALLNADGTIPSERTIPGVALDSLRAESGSVLPSGDRFDTSTVAALGLLACAEQRQDLLKGAAGAMYDRVTGRIIPLYAMAAGSDSARLSVPLAEACSDALRSARIQMGIVGLADRLRSDSASWASLFLSIDSAWVPVLARGRNIGLAQAEVDRSRNAFMQRLFHPDPAAFIGLPVPVPGAVMPKLDPWLAKFRSQPDTLRFVRGKYAIDHDLVIPAGIALVLERGTRWNIAPGVSVVVNGELHIRGTDVNPVFIRPQNEEQPYGGIAVNGDGSTRCRVKGLRISGGSGAWDNGVRYGGMLSFHRSHVRLEHCRIGPSHGAAAVSIRRGTVALNDVEFTGAENSFVDLAEVGGTLEQCAFAELDSGDGGTKGSSGLRMLGSHVLVRKCSFAGLPFVALRVGHASEAMVLETAFTGNSVAISASDGSVVDVGGCTFTSNGTVFRLRKEHAVLGGAVLNAQGNSLSGNPAVWDVGPASRADTTSVLDPERRRSFGLAQ